MSPLWIILTLLPILGGAARFNCKGRILGAYYADSKSGCKAFHVCVRVAGGGIRDFRFFCPPGTLFHQEAQTCTDWGDDDPLACPAIYDGQFDLYKTHPGFETKKLSSVGNREEETEFGLQRAETGDRRSQNNANDLRAAHSSDFFSGQRDRGRDEPVQTSPQPQPQPQPVRTAAPPVPRQSFRRATTPRQQPTTQPTTPPPQPTYQPQYEVSKRKIVRKRPVYASSPAPQSTFAQNPTQYQEPQTFQDNFNKRPQQQNRQPPTTTPNVPPQFKEYKDEYVEVSRVTPKPNRYYPANPTPLPSSHATSPPQYTKKDGLVELYNYDAQSTPGLTTKQGKYKVKNSFSVTDLPQEDFARIRPNNNNNNNNFNNNNNNFNDNNNNFNNNNDNFNNNNNNFNNNKKEDFNNNYYIKKDDFNNNNNFKNTNRPAPTTTIDYNSAARTTTNTPAYKNFNSVSYEQEKNNFVSFAKNYNNPTTIPTTTTYYTTYRPESPQNLNTVAYDTNNGFHSQSNFAEPSSEDDGQYRLPQGEDDGQYRPEIYERELLSGAHSLNIAASGNRLPEDQKQYSKTKAPAKFVSQTAAPRPFRPAPAAQTTRAPEPTTSVSPQTQRAFDQFKTYTTTSRPTDYTGGPPDFVPINNAPIRPTTTPRVETRPPKTQTRPAHAPTFPPNPAPRPTTQPPFSKPVNKKEDNSYDYAYYDSDSGFSDYDRIEEFGRTKKRE